MTTKTSFFSGTGQVLALVIGALVLAGGGFAAGRYATPEKVVVTEKVVEVVKEVVVEKIKTEVKVVRVEDRETVKKLHREIWELKHPDGREEKKVTEDLNVNDVIHTKENTVQVVYVDKIIEKQVEKVVEKEKLVLNTPNWRVGAGVGVAIPTFLGQQQIGTPGLQGAVIQVEIDRRIVGPFSIGAFGNTQGTAGLTLSGTF